jgi:hypothetical protein
MLLIRINIALAFNLRFFKLGKAFPTGLNLVCSVQPICRL